VGPPGNSANHFAIACAFRPGSVRLLQRAALAVLSLAAVLGCRSASPARAQMAPLATSLNLARMVDESENIVRARVIAVRAEPHPQYQNLQTVAVTLEVIEPLKGSPGSQLVFRQYNPDMLEAKSTLGYRTGEEIVLMLRKPSAEGLTSPVGFEQGRFLVQRDASGATTVRNSMDNAALFDGIDAASPALKARLTPPLQALIAQHRSGPIPYDQFKSIVAGLIAAGPAAR